VRRASDYAAAVAVVTAAGLVAWFVFGEAQLTDVVMVFLLGVVVVSMKLGYGPSLLAAVLSVVAFEFFFIPPLFSFAVSDLRHVVTFAVMLLVAIVISHQTRRIRSQADSASARERDTASLLAASREIGLAYSREALLAAAVRHARAMFAADVVVLVPSPEGRLEAAGVDGGAARCAPDDVALAERAWRENRPESGVAGVLASNASRMVTLGGSRGRVGMLVVFQPPSSASAHDPPLLEAFAGLVGSALERTMLAEEARRATVRVEAEQIRNALLSSVSHDLKTPLSVVMGATGALLDRPPKEEEKRRALVMTAHHEAVRLNRFLGNLLDMTRLEGGALIVRKEWQPLEEVIGAALNRLDDRMLDREVTTTLPSDLPLVPFDSLMIEQVLVNLLENAAKHTQPGMAVDVTARMVGGAVEVEVADRGPGVAKEDTERVFDKFYRAREREGGGVGLGLTICRGIILAHGGRIWVSPRAGGGASFCFTLPIDDGTPHNGSTGPRPDAEAEPS
jgi:two-component system sensor histidine kinase KdpD